MVWAYGLLAFAAVFFVHVLSRVLEYNKKIEDLRKIPCYRPRFLIGNLYDFGFLKLGNLKQLISDTFYVRLGASMVLGKQGMFVGWMGPIPIVFLTNARTAEVILSSHVLIEKSRFYRVLSDSLGAGLFISSGEKWRQHRKMAAPAFHSRVLETFLDTMNNQSTILVDVLKRKSEGKEWLDPKEAVHNCVLDILVESTVDYKLNAQTESPEYVSLIERLSTMVCKRLYSPWLHSRIYYLFPEGREFWKLTQYAQNIVDEKFKELVVQIKEREMMGTTSKRNTFIDLLFTETFTHKELRDNVNTFVAAGHHTVGNSLCWLMYVLGLYKDVQTKLFEEILSVFPGGTVEEVTMNHLKELKYMDCVIKECHRLYTTAPDIGRLLTEDIVIDGYRIPKGTDCVISIAGIHRDPEVYPEPERFDPDRFLPENSVGRPQYAFIPFSAGPRNCIGQRYAEIKTKVILCHIISKLTVHSLDPEDKMILLPEIVCKPMGPLRIVFGPRNLSD